METVEQLGSGLRLIQDDSYFKLSMDSALLARFPALHSGERVCDLGCGVGVLPLLLLARDPSLQIDGIEISPGAAALARRNMEGNGFAGQGRIETGDLRQIARFFPAGAYHLVVSNPPYFPASSGLPARTPARSAARAEESCPLDALCGAAAYLLRYGGRFALVHRPERLADLICSLRQAGLEPKQMRLVSDRTDRPPSLLLLEARRGGRAGLTLTAPLILSENVEQGRC